MLVGGGKRTLIKKSALFAVLPPAHCRMENREGGVIVKVYIIFFFL